METETQLKDKCCQLMRSVAHKRSTYPQHCTKHVSRALQCNIDQMISAAEKIKAPAPEADGWDITDKLIEDNCITFEKLKSLNHFNKIDESLEEAKDILKILNQISNESSSETDQVMATMVKSKD